MVNFEERADLMVRAYGEVCKRSDAARLLNVDSRTINAMLSDGRLDWACQGTRVDVRSIARFIAAPAEAEENARIERLKRRAGSEYVVV